MSVRLRGELSGSRRALRTRQCVRFAPGRHCADRMVPPFARVASGDSAAATIQVLSDGVATPATTPLRAIRQSKQWDFPLPMAYEKIRYEVADSGIATVTLDDPDTRNSLSNQLLGELIEAFEAARDDESVRCVVLASSHEKV